MTSSTSVSLDWFALAIELSGGVALFPYGLNQLSDGLKHAAGEGLKKTAHSPYAAAGVK
jgi:phosphate:Na+ symporter